MEIRQFRVVIRAKHFDRTCKFYQDSLALPRLQTWERDDARGSVFQVGEGLVEVVGRPSAGESPLAFDEAHDYQGPRQKLTLELTVPSAEKAYEELLFRDKNIPGGLRKDVAGTLVFETHDPDGVRIVYRQADA
jgi:catechol 2,3-dioxygenase-like lactoylglutathione lyase family enzyme